MKILLIEDDIVKRNDIIDTLCLARVAIKDNFTLCTNIVCAKKLLREEMFDVMLLDINLPMREDSTDIVSKSGLTFFKEIKQHRNYNQPKEIIGITAYEDEYKEVKKEFEESLLHVVHYHTVKEKWKDRLIERFEHLVSSNLDSNDYNYDLAIICALDDPELKAVRKLSESWERIKIDNTSIPFYKTYFIFGDKKLKVVISSINKMGMVATSVLATQTIELFKPKYIAMTGIAAGIKKGDEINLGDILVASPSWDSGAGKIKKDTSGEPLFEIAPKQENMDSDILNNCLELSGDSVFLNKLREDWEYKKIKSVLSVHIGPVASGAAVIANSEVSKEIVNKQQRDLIGIEMEAYGLIYAARHATHPRPEPLVFKSVCDFADEHKNDGYQSYASYTSANFLYEYAKRFIN